MIEYKPSTAEIRHYREQTGCGLMEARKALMRINLLHLLKEGKSVGPWSKELSKNDVIEVLIAILEHEL